MTREEAIKAIKAWDFLNDDEIEVIETLIPELAESENEKIKRCVKYAIDKLFLKEKIVCDVHKDDVLAWLEKQGTPYTERDIDDAYLKGISDTKNEIEKQYEATYQIRKDIATFIFNRGDIKDRAKWMNYLGIKVSIVEKQGEQKVSVADFKAKDWYVSKVDGKIHNIHHSVDKVEPKFKVGDWVVCEVTGSVYQIKNRIENLSNHKYGYDLTNGGYIGSDEVNHYHIWTIEDALDGDVLQLGEVTAIFKEYIGNGDCKCYCSVYRGEFEIPTQDSSYGCYNATPATKEQCDTLFAKIHEAGYEWDAEKKELKKIEQSIDIPFGAKDSELQEVSYYIPEGFHAKIDGDKVVIKKGEQKPVWSEEDSVRLQRIIDFLWYNRKGDTDTIYQQEQDIDWLKSLKERYTWKPSDEQMEAMQKALVDLCGKDEHNIITGLYYDLKKIKG